MLNARTLDDRFDLAARLSPSTTALLWLFSALVPIFGASGAWFMPLLAFALLGLALPTKTLSPEHHPRPWTAVSLASALAFVSAIRAEELQHANDAPVVGIVIALLCGEAMVAAIPLAIGASIDRALAPRWEHGRGRMRLVTVAAMCASLAFSGLALSRFHGRAEPGLVSLRALRELRLLGVYQPLGSRCPTRCDEGPNGARRDGANLLASLTTDEIVPGVTLERTRLDAMSTRARLLINPEGSAPRYVFDRRLPPGQALRVATDPSRSFVMLDFGQHPRTTVRLSDGASFTESARRSERLSIFHAPTIYVLTALAGIALAAWLLVESRRTRRSATQQEGWRDATVDDDRMIVFDGDLPPTPLPGYVTAGVREVVVTSCTAPLGVGYRSDGVVTIHSLFEGTRAQLLAHLHARSTVLEHSAFATLAVTVAPLVGVRIFGETW